MNTNLVSKVGEIGQDNLIAKLNPPAETYGVVLAKLSSGADAVTVKRGTVLGMDASGKMSVYGGAATAKTAKFSGDGSAKTFTLTDKPADIEGVKVGTTDADVDDYNPYTGVVTLHTAPAAGTDNVVVSYSLPTGSAPVCILADDATVTDAADVTGVAYRTGHFNRKALIVATGYNLTINDEEALRHGGILLSNMMA